MVSVLDSGWHHYGQHNRFLEMLRLAVMSSINQSDIDENPGVNDSNRSIDWANKMPGFNGCDG
jgi:hypothetical protein